MTKRKKPTARKPWDLEYLPYFTELCLIHGWPHRDWLPSEWGRDQSAASKQATANRDAQVARGNLGTIVGLSERSDARLLAVPKAPGWVREA